MAQTCSRMTQEILQSPIGKMKLESCPKGVHLLAQVAEDDKNFSPDLSICVEVMANNGENTDYGHAMSTVHWLQKYFADPSSTVELCSPDLCSNAFSGKFSEIICRTLMAVKPGQLVSYMELGEKAMFDRNCARAVGGAVGNNPIQIIVPCHRVIPGTRHLGNYAHGKKNEVKKWLLELEGFKFDENNFLCQ